MKEVKRLVIVSESVVDRNGNHIGDDPKEFSIITNRCKAMAKSLETGLDYQVV